MDTFTQISQYMPHGMCLLWKPWLVVLWGGSDLLIALSYFAIPVALMLVLRQRSEMPQAPLVWLFAAFILLCGLTHVLSIVTLWVPIYPAMGVVKLVTGIASMTTAVMLFRLIPKLVALPSPSAMREVDRELQAEMAAHDHTLGSLEEQVTVRTADLQRENDHLSLTAHEAVHRGGNLLNVVTAIAWQSARGSERTAEFIDTFSGRLNALGQANASVLDDGSEGAREIGELVSDQLHPLLMTFPDQVQIDGPACLLQPEAAQQVALAVHELATNAQKYNLGSAPGARVAIRWRARVYAGGETGLDLSWIETLGSDSAARLRRKAAPGFGTELLTSIIPGLLGGSARREIIDHELRYRLEVPPAALVGEAAGEEKARKHAARA